MVSVSATRSPVSASSESGAAPAASLLSTNTIGPWKLVAELGEGTWSRVYLAKPADAAESQPPSFALKLAKTLAADDARGWTQLCREARLARQVQDRHVVPVLEASLHAAPYYLVFPYLQGMNLATQLKHNLPMVPTALWLVRQMAQGLRALHAAGWMHGDLKPANVMVAPSGHTTLIDFGLARPTGETPRETEVELFGTLEYLAPERWRSVTAGDIRSDIYSLGVMLFEMLTGRCPLNAEEGERWEELHRQTVQHDVRQLAPQLPTRLARLIRQMLAQQPIRRPQTPDELIDRLIELEVVTFGDRTANWAVH